jgi:hypothetical protein
MTQDSESSSRNCGFRYRMNDLTCARRGGSVEEAMHRQTFTIGGEA